MRSKPVASLSDSISTLNISEPSTPPQRKGAKSKPAAVADSWEDEASSGDEAEPSDPSAPPAEQLSVKLPETQLQPTVSRDLPRAPPPTPAVRRAPTTDWSSAAGKFEAFAEHDHVGYGFAPEQQQQQQQREDKRPEKSTAVASRLIAAGLGVKAPRRTEEQREYDKAVRAQEKKKKEQKAEEERRRKEDDDKARAAIWEG
ncbi:hypothetical protein ANO11243_040780 [Dothideomycetidae sp. 11243]|nr:hypothetical protein ANO11243_040780 [fungal sp. No.11243]